MILTLLQLKIIDINVSCEYYGYDCISRCKYGPKTFKGIETIYDETDI